MVRPTTFPLACAAMLALSLTDTTLASSPDVKHRARAFTAAPASHWQTLLSAPTIHAPTSLAIDLRGRASAGKWAYVFDRATGRIVKFGTGGRSLRSWPSGVSGAAGSASVSLAVGGKGNLFAADPTTGTISKFSPLGVLLQRWSGFAGSGSIAVDGRGEIYVAHGYMVDTLYGGGGYVGTLDTHFVWKGGPAGQSIAVALDPPEHSWYLATECTVGDDCGSVVGTGARFDRKSVLLLLAGGTVRKAWFGLGHAASGRAQETPGMQSRDFVTIDAMVNDARGNLYVAGNLWPRGGKQGRGVVAYTPRGARLGLWYLPFQAPVGGIALDGRDTIYVSQAGRVLKHTLSPR